MILKKSNYKGFVIVYCIIRSKLWMLIE